VRAHFGSFLFFSVKNNSSLHPKIGNAENWFRIFASSAVNWLKPIWQKAPHNSEPVSFRTLFAAVLLFLLLYFFRNSGILRTHQRARADGVGWTNRQTMISAQISFQKFRAIFNFNFQYYVSVKELRNIDAYPSSHTHARVEIKMHCR
jgi:hypothetical protein